MGRESTSTALIERVAKLERSNRRFRTIALACVAAGAVFLSLGLGGKQTLKANAIQLIDAEGRLRLMLSATSGVSLLDDAGRPRAVLTLDRSGPGLALYGETSRLGVSLDVNASGPALALRGKGGQTRALLALIDEGPGLILSDDQGRERAAVIARSDGASFTALDANGKPAWKAP